MDRLLFRFEISVDDSHLVEVIQSESKLGEVKLHVLLGKHNLRTRKETMASCCLAKRDWQLGQHGQYLWQHGWAYGVCSTLGLGTMRTKEAIPG